MFVCVRTTHEMTAQSEASSSAARTLSQSEIFRSHPVDIYGYVKGTKKNDVEEDKRALKADRFWERQNL